MANRWHQFSIFLPKVDTKVGSIKVDNVKQIMAFANKGAVVGLASTFFCENKKAKASSTRYVAQCL